MPDYEAEFNTAVRDVISMLTARGRPQVTWTLSDGGAISGWRIDSDSYSKEWSERNSWWERWGTHTFILRDDATIWQVLEDSEEGSSFEGVRKVISAYRETNLAGSRGKPFSYWLEKIERLPYG